MKKSRVIKKALTIAVKSGEDINNLIGIYTDQLLKEALQKQNIKRKGFGYERKTDFSDPRSGEDDGVCGESQQPEQPGEP
jgi:hypothetical protein